MGVGLWVCKSTLELLEGEGKADGVGALELVGMSV